MNETRALATRQTLTPKTWEMIQSVAPVMQKARLFGVSSTEQAAAIMLKGHELGIGLAASFEFIVVIQGKPSLVPRGALALVLQSDLLEGMKVSDEPNACTVWMKRKGGLEYQLTYTLEQAQKAGLVKPNSAWESYGPNMLRWRCIGFVIDVLFPDVIGGLKRADELGAAVNEDGEIVEGEWAAVAAEPAPARNGHATLDDLVSQFGADAVMEAAGGTIPGTTEEVAKAAAALGVANV